MTDNREILNDAEVDFLLQGAETDAANEAPQLEDGNQTVTMHGDLDQISLADIFQTLAMSKMEGVLRVRNPLEERQVYCSDGYVRILVPARLTLRRLGQRLIQAGLLQADQLRSALVEQRKDRIPLGQLLVRDGLITQEELDEIIGMQVAEDLFALFTWKHGTFEFFKGDPGSTVLRSQFESCPEYEVNSLLLEVARRSDEWQLILDQVQSLDEIPKQVAQPANPDDLDETHDAVLNGIDGRSTYRQLADQTTLGLFDFSRAARDLAQGGILENIDDPQLIQVATELAEEGESKRAVVLLQTLRDRPGDRSLGVIRGMAEVLEQVGERRFASSLLLEAAQRSAVAEEALELARAARALVPYDPGTLSFLRTVLVAHCEPDSAELEKVTIDLLDALIDGDLVPTALEIIEDARRTDTVRPQILMREARARQKAKDVDGAVESLLELAECYLEDGNREKAAEAYDAVMRLDRSRKDVQRQLAALKRTRLGSMIRLAAILLVTALVGGMGFVWWQQSAFEAALQNAQGEIQQLLDQGDRNGARTSLDKWRTALGDCETIQDLASRVAFADAAENKRLEKIRRGRLTERMSEAAERLGRGELADALAIYVEVHAERGMSTEVTGVVSTRLQAMLTELQRSTKELDGQLPPDPAELFDRGQLATNLASMQEACPPALLRAHDELAAMQSRSELPEFLNAAELRKIDEALAAVRPAVERIRARTTAYTAALQRNDTERRLDPLFKAAVEKETAHDFEGALELYRKLEAQPTGDPELRAHFRDRVTRNATITRLLKELDTATNAGDFGGAQQQLKALRMSFPEVPFDTLVRLPLTVDSQPPGATVLVNGLDVGATPIVLKRVPAEPTVVAVSVDGFDQVEQTFTGDQNSTWTAQLTLQPLRVRSHDGAVETPPTLLPSGDLVFVDRSGDVTRLDPTLRAAAWKFPSNDLSGYLSPALLVDDQLLVASLDGKLRGIGADDGKLRWELAELPCEVAPALVGRMLALATSDGRLHTIDLAERRRIAVDLGQRACDDLLQHAGNAIVVGDRGRISCWSMDLKPVWKRDLDGVDSPRARLSGDVVVVGDDQGRLFGLAAKTGEVVWRRDVGQAPLGRFEVAAGHVLVATPEQIARFDAATGAVLDPFPRCRADWASRPYVIGNRLVAAMRDGDLQVLDRDSGKPLYLLAGDARSRVLQTAGRLFVVTPEREVRYHGPLR
jgi:type IV pilus assembly protein PilB